jgi:hypothetical protein
VFLDKVPYGFHADESRAAWGAWTIYKTGQDDWGNRFPLYYDTFGDQRPTGIFYATIPFLIIFGKNVTAARLPMSVVGALGVIGLFWLTQLITNNKKVALFSALILALSPWHIVMSRSGSEGVASGTLILFGLSFWIAGLKENNNNKLLYSVGFAVLSYFFYHTARILVPVYWIASWWLGKTRGKKGILLSAVLIGVTLLFSMQGESRGRFSQVSIFTSPHMKQDLLRASIEEGPNRVFVTRFFHNKLVWYSKQYAEHYLEYFSGEFLVGNASLPLRYKIPYTGLLTYADLFLFIVGVGYLIRSKKYYLIGLLLILSPIVAAVTETDIPNLHRSLNMIFFIAILEGLGIYYLLNKLKGRKWIWVLLVSGYVLMWVFFWHNYTVHTSKTIIPYHRDGGSLELAQKLMEVKEQYSKIYLTDTPTDLTPWIGFVGNWDVDKYIEQAKYRRENDWSIDQFYFIKRRCPTFSVNNPEDGSLLVDAEGCVEPQNTESVTYQLDFTINRPEGTWVYKGWKVIR